MLRGLLNPVRAGKRIAKNYFVESANTDAEKGFIEKLSRYKIKWQPAKKEIILSQALKDYAPCLSLAPVCHALAKKENANVGIYTVMTRLEDNDYSDNYLKQKIYTDVSYKKLDKIYLSYGGKIVFRNIWLHKNQEAIETNFKQIKKSINSKEDIIKIEIEGVKIGDLIYDTCLRFDNKPTFEIDNPFLDKVIIQALHLYFNCKNLLKQYNVKALVHLYATYIHHGVIVRLCLKNNIPVYAVGSHNFIVKRIHENYPSHTNDHFLFHKIFEKLDNKQEKIQLAKELFERRFTGKVDTAIAYMRTNAFSNEQNEELKKYDWSKTIVVLAHCFFDSPHVYRSLLFTDFYEWLTATLDTLSQLKDVTVLIKPHPNGRDGNDEIFETFHKKYKGSNIEFIDKHTSNLQILQLNPKAVVTAHGTAAAEFTYFDIPVVNVYDNPFTAYNFTHTARSVDEYKSFLLQIASLPNINNKEHILEHYYMHYVFFMCGAPNAFLNLTQYGSQTFDDEFLKNYMPSMTDEYFDKMEGYVQKGFELINWLENQQLN